MSSLPSTYGFPPFFIPRVNATAHGQNPNGIDLSEQEIAQDKTELIYAKSSKQTAPDASRAPMDLSGSISTSSNEFDEQFVLLQETLSRLFYRSRQAQVSQVPLPQPKHVDIPYVRTRQQPLDSQEESGPISRSLNEFDEQLVLLQGTLSRLFYRGRQPPDYISQVPLPQPRHVDIPYVCTRQQPPNKVNAPIPSKKPEQSSLSGGPIPVQNKFKSPEEIEAHSHQMLIAAQECLRESKFLKSLDFLTMGLENLENPEPYRATDEMNAILCCYQGSVLIKLGSLDRAITCCERGLTLRSVSELTQIMLRGRIELANSKKERLKQIKFNYGTRL